jgi:hypothetical protein
MTSAKQIKANQLNSQNSTGPKTTEGKASVSKNSLKHGLLSKETVLQWENRQEFETFKDSILQALKPANALEDLLADKIVSLAWRLQRSRRIETGIITQQRLSLNFQIEIDEAKLSEKDLSTDIIRKTVEQCAEAATMSNPDHAELGVIFEKDADTLTKLQRYEASQERSFYKALHELQRVQAMRRGENVTLPLAVDVNGERMED